MSPEEQQKIIAMKAAAEKAAAIEAEKARQLKPTTPAKVRRARREEAKKLPPPARVAAAKLLPASRNQMAAKIEEQKARVKEIMSYQPRTTEEAIKQKALLNEEAKKLAGIVGASKAQRVRRAKQQAGTVQLSEAQAKARKAAVLAELDMVKQASKETKQSAAKASSAQAAMSTKEAILQKKEEVLKERCKLLDQGKDIDRPKKVDPSTVPMQRKPLRLPPASVPPQKIETVTIMRMLAKVLPRMGSESVESYQARLREMTKRVLVRIARMGSLAGRDRGEVMKTAIEETLQEDAEVIRKEVEATGGVAKDPAADAMDPYIDEVAADLEAAATDVVPPVPAGDPTPEQVVDLLQQAEEEELIAAAAPREESDEIAEDLLLADVPVPYDAGDVSDFFTPRNLLIGSALVAGAYLLLRE